MSDIPTVMRGKVDAAFNNAFQIAGARAWVVSPGAGAASLCDDTPFPVRRVHNTTETAPCRGFETGKGEAVQQSSEWRH
jgi:hypothetical protein